MITATIENATEFSAMINGTKQLTVDNSGVTIGTANTANMNVSSALNAYSLDVAYDAVVQSCLTAHDLIVEDSLVELSSAALKTDVTPIEGALSKIMSLFLMSSIHK